MDLTAMSELPADTVAEIARKIEEGDLKGAMEAANAALRERPDFAPALHMLGLVAHLMGDQGLAISFVEKAHAQEPEWREYPALLAYLYASIGRLSDALYYAKLSTALAPHELGAYLLPAGLPMNQTVFDHVNLSMHSVLGLSALLHGRFQDAVRECEAELRIDPRHFDAMVTLGRAHIALGNIDSAIGHLRGALNLRPDAAAPHRWLGDALLAAGEHDQALAAWRTALALETEDDSGLVAHILSRLPLQSEGNHTASAAFAAELRERVDGGRKPTRCHPETSPYIGVLWDECHAGPLADFLLPVFEHMQNVILYRLAMRTDAVTEATRARVMRFQDCADLDPATFDRVVAGDMTNILINLCSSAGEGQYPLLTGAKAPHTLQWLGAPLPDRLPGADRVIGSAATREVDAATFGADAIVTLPQLLAWRFPATGVEAETVGPLPRDAKGQVTFGAVGDLRRIGADLVAMWAAILRAVPGSTLLLGAPPGAWQKTAAEKLSSLFANFGLVERVHLQGPHDSGAVNLDLYARVDILLDTAPVNGLNEVAEALWMGVPVVTRKGSRRAGCTGAAILEAAGRAEWIAPADADYVALAANLAFAPDLAKTRAGLRDATAASSLCDVKGFAAALQAALGEAAARSADAA